MDGWGCGRKPDGGSLARAAVAIQTEEPTSSAPFGRYLITMAVPIFDPGRSPGMKTYQGGEEIKRKKGEEEEKKQRKESQSI